jgi:L,D-peptidoglycan transpeptidase YkuD (ErfK/YbiS/YcfS/YnhG family)
VSVFQRPAAGIRRRPLLYPCLAGALACLAACASEPPPDFEPARRAARTAIALVRTSEPTKARYLERLVADAEVACAGERAAPWWQSQQGRGQAAWLRTVVAAREACAAHREVHGRARQRYLSLLSSVSANVSRARSEMRETGMGRREAAAMERAVTNLTTGQRLAAGGDYQRAADKLQKANELAGVVHRGWSSVHARFSDPTLLRKWKRWAEMTIAESRDSGETAILVDKLRRRLTIYFQGLKMVEFSAELGANGLRRKEHAGDRATPEGMYRVVQLKWGRNTKYYKALLLNYPNSEDLERYNQGKRQGTIPRRAGPGSLIEIHGEGGEGKDWTDGCVALANDAIDTVFARSKVGTPVTIVGTYVR